MARVSLWALAVLLLVGASSCAHDCCKHPSDRLQFGNVPSGEEWGVLIDGTTAAGPVDDRVATGVGAELVLENFQAGPDSEEEVIAVTRGRALELVGAAWTEAEGDLVEIDFDPAIEIPLTIWIVRGPFKQGSDHAADQVLTASSLWQQEHMGIRLGSVEIVDATTDADAGTYHYFKCGDRQNLESEIGSRPGRINVYRVERVNDSPFAADACGYGTGFAALGQSTTRDILAHEIGHSFGLEHPDEPFWLPGFGYENVMVSFSSDREFITEGQVFRAHVGPISVINALYAARPGKPVRQCPHSAASGSCPALATRIWPDVPPPAPSGDPLSPAPPVAPTPPPPAPPPPAQPDAEELARNWLLRSCETGVIELQGRMRTQADALAEILVAAFHRGASEELVAKAERAARARFERRRRGLANPAAVGLSHIDLARLAAVTEADYVARESNAVHLAYRTQALRGLLIVSPERALPLLVREAGDSDSPLRGVAAGLLESHSGP